MEPAREEMRGRTEEARDSLVRLWLVAICSEERRAKERVCCLRGKRRADGGGRLQSAAARCTLFRESRATRRHKSFASLRVGQRARPQARG